LWCYEEAVAQSINQAHKNNLFLKNIILPSNIVASTDIATVLRDDVAFVIEAIPVTYLMSVCTLIKQSYALKQYWIVTSKGLDPVTGHYAGKLMQQFFGAELKVLVLGGPSFALELVQNVPTAWSLATNDHSLFVLLQPFWQTAYTTLYFSDDREGSSLCGALKNVAAVLLGMLDGAGYGKNTQAFILTIVYKEIKRFIILCGGKEKTVDGLAGFGDLFLTVSTNVSKNRIYGYLVGQKQTSDEINKQLPVVPEGVSTASGLHALFSHFGNNRESEFPLLSSVYHILQGTQSIDDQICRFFNRQ
jgi:glycerol-3-phosphate dehydrogenase (NAD(P)+)